MNNKTILYLLVIIAFLGIFWFTTNRQTTSPTPTPPTDVSQPVPPAAEVVRLAAAEAMALPEAEVVVTQVNEVEWPNSCLGLADEDEMCAEVITPGYQVILEANDQEYVYHTNEDGTVIRQNQE
jgi:hypothetical protein